MVVTVARAPQAHLLVLVLRVALALSLEARTVVVAVEAVARVS